MPHITEGLLHAHLDGALGPDEQLQWAEAEVHLEVCDDCRRRLAEAADLRDAARDLLAAAGPVTRPATRPAFEELAARARARRAEPTPDRKTGRAAGTWWRTPATLGWAASLVIAAGAGWIGRQLVVEQGLDAPRVAAEQAPPVGRTGVDEGAALDDLRNNAVPEGARTRRDAAATPAAPETAARFRAEAEPRQRGQLEAEELQEKADPRAEAGFGADLEPEADADAEAGADVIRMEEIAPLAAAAEATSGARCYAATPAAGDGRKAAGGQPETLSLAVDGTATLRLDGRPLVGFWQHAEADSLRLRMTDGEQWWELALVEAEDGVRGDAELDAVPCP